MSYDLRVWGRRPANLADHLPPTQGWIERDGSWALEERNWQITISAIQVVESEDVPPAVSDAIPGVSTLTEISLEPATAPKAALKVLSSTARALAEALEGVIDDPRDVGPRPRRGKKRFAKPKREERFDVLELHWWYLNSPLRESRGVAEFLEVLKRHAPEALPRRYGPYEPPRFKTEETGLGALADFLHQNLESFVILAPTRPVLSLHVSHLKEGEQSGNGFRSNHLSLDVELKALEQPGWECAVKRLWRGLSSFLRPFYGEARVTKGHTWAGTRPHHDLETEVHPVCSWWWRGIPPKPGLAMVIGPPYSALWPMEGADRVGDLHFLEQADWSAGRSLDIEAPAELAQRWVPRWVRGRGGGYSVNWCDAYPPTWPFPDQ